MSSVSYRKYLETGTPFEESDGSPIGHWIFKQNGEWWFWDETDSHMIGPYRSRDEAADKMIEYAAMLNRKSKYED